MDNNLSKRELAYIEYEKQFTDEELQEISDKNNEIPKWLLIVGLPLITIVTAVISYAIVFAPPFWWIK